MVSGVFGMVSGIYGRFGRLWKVPEGSGVIRTTERSPDGSIIGAAMLPLRARQVSLRERKVL